jgi:Putative MetA-pathway of phenol degradation
LISASAIAHAQQALISADGRPPSPTTVIQPSGGQEEDYIKPSRPGVAMPAEIQKSGVLQVEFGYDANFRAGEFRDQQTAPLDIRFAASSRLLLALDFETVKSEADEEGQRETGVGDTRLGSQWVALKDNESHPALAFAYYVKLPSASEEKGLGTGRIDHKAVLLLSKKFGKAEMDINAAYLNVGREDSDRRASGGQGAISFSYEFKNNLGVEGELSGQSLDDVQPRGIFALGALTYKVSKRIRFDGGVRFGLNPEAPRVGVFAGVTIGVANIFGK